MNETLHVELGQGRYPIYFREQALGELSERIMRSAKSGRVIVVTDDHVGPLHATPLVNVLRGRGLNTELVQFAHGESNKTLETVRQIYENAVGFGVDRDTPIIGLGGGVVGDVAGFVAATILRGVPFIQVPTSVLAQVDSSVGGKVGVNLQGGKNLVGAFYQPDWGMIDADYLKTLPESERRAGYAEAIKHAAIADASLLKDLTTHAASLRQADSATVLDVLPRVVGVNSSIVAEDEKDRGIRNILNFGHTLGHAMESHSMHDGLGHGEAVALGMRAMLAFSQETLGLSRSDARLVHQALDAMDLPGDWAPRISPEVLKRIHLDKKTTATQLSIILLRALGDPVIKTVSVEDFITKISALARKQLASEAT